MDVLYPKLHLSRGRRIHIEQGAPYSTYAISSRYALANTSPDSSQQMDLTIAQTSPSYPSTPHSLQHFGSFSGTSRLAPEPGEGPLRGFGDLQRLAAWRRESLLDRSSYPNPSKIEYLLICISERISTRPRNNAA